MTLLVFMFSIGSIFHPHCIEPLRPAYEAGFPPMEGAITPDGRGATPDGGRIMSDGWAKWSFSVLRLSCGGKWFVGSIALGVLAGEFQKVLIFSE